MTDVELYEHYCRGCILSPSETVEVFSLLIPTTAHSTWDWTLWDTGVINLRYQIPYKYNHIDFLYLQTQKFTKSEPYRGLNKLRKVLKQLVDSRELKYQFAVQPSKTIKDALELYIVPIKHQIQNKCMYSKILLDLD